MSPPADVDDRRTASDDWFWELDAKGQTDNYPEAPTVSQLVGGHERQGLDYCGGAAKMEERMNLAN